MNKFLIISKFFIFTYLFLSTNILAHQNHADIPCDASLKFGQLLVFSFPTHTTNNEDILKLNDGVIYIGIEMSVEGEDLNFNKKFNVKYEKEGENLLGSNNWSNQELDDDYIKKLGQFPQSDCTFLGASNKK